MPIECLISFDNNPQGVYYAGQELSGVVDLSVDTTKRIKSIHITVSGYARIRWIKKGYPRDSERAICRAYRSYLSSRSYVLGTCASSSYIDWVAGSYSYTFHVILPGNLPTSFEGKHGQIHYEILTTIERAGRYARVFRLPFTVIHPFDLNVDTIYRVPLEILQRKRFWSFCCPTGPLTVKFSTPYCGYAPGQKIHFVLYINNESSIDITACEVKLKQEVVYEAHDPQHEYRHDRQLIARKQFGNVLRWSRKVYRGFLDLPSMPPTSAKISCPISVTYAMKIVVSPTEFHWKMKLKVPLTIGSIPIMENALPMNGSELSTRLTAAAAAEAAASASAAGTLAATTSGASDATATTTRTPALRITSASMSGEADNPPDYVAMMPPSYTDAMALSDKFYDDLECLQNISMSSIASNNKAEPYKPRYPVYYEYETPIIPPETLFDDSPTQLRVALQPTSESTTTMTDLVECGSQTNFNILRLEKE